ncbi:MAG: signal peptidase [Thermoanaerobaculia bacterium]|jgi:signal peptidase I|nr:signal peptidase [Thermoanaerobaculia bacterium]
MDKKKVFYEARVFLLMLLVISSLRSALADWNDVPTGSMKPTIEEGDRVVVNKLAYDLKLPFTMIELIKWSDPKRGDIVVLFSPADGVRLVKRVVGLPGDKIEMRENQLFVNGNAAIWKPAGQREDEEQGSSLIVEETLEGKTHAVLFMLQNPSPMRTFGPLMVPAGHYFVMGDNRDNSNDSRYIGMIERRRIVGKALAVAFSVDRNHWYRPRLQRFFKKIQ